ncbi:hypothetical protein [Pedobacter cryotolerans]|uniref:Outer membrane protein beta-barrel domain-containing protein n=1 Tax=Pedobacter cryotolerans TaxID=2571270 RepID=A0A4U1C2U0_9SPHI|nr:hypothetical protein [Pedobacter cryotolerans]TKB99375.1 hypothetical protein FA045_12875 [Pedobacter cryotolerans]
MRIRTLLTMLICVFIFTTTKAQISTIGIGPELNVPTGNSSNISSIGASAAIKVELGLSPKTGLTINSGITSFLGRNYFGIRTPAETAVPLKGGFKYYTSPNFYVEGQVGTNFPISGNAKSGFVWSPGVGTYLKLRNSDNQLDVGLRYEGWSSRRTITATNATFSTFSFIGLRVAYAFNL